MELRPFVERYSWSVDRLGDARIYNPLPARSNCFLQLYLGDRYEVVTVASGAVHCAPRFVLVGPHTRRREDVVWTGTLLCFTIQFTPVGLRALFGVPARLICDYAGSAEAVLGQAVVELEQRLAAAAEGQLGLVADRFLLERWRCGGAAKDGSVVARMARQMQRQHGGVGVAQLAKQYDVSVRQIERGFQEYVGISPKVFGRLARMGLTLRLGAESAKPDWAGIAAAAGYFDQSHMVREFRELNAATPVDFMSLRKRASTGAGPRQSAR